MQFCDLYPGLLLFAVVVLILLDSDTWQTSLPILLGWYDQPAKKDKKLCCLHENLFLSKEFYQRNRITTVKD